ncbi:Slp family lipoprotein [Geobacter argillaceus]|uniref:Outer membrane lipoprotein n=1 Tax=Geobacter argillaceus TaxID=345631 RepID=A0A562WU83_9BACT|nr:Slp family lipoprotein [Geobacter argillaceus]TWJ33572.1 outer membrane lipoprotein [Geobacter argillaceus]
MKRIIALLPALLLMTGICFGFTEEALKLVDDTITFDELRDNPARYVGKQLLLGGTIVLARPKSLEIAQLPLDARHKPDDSFSSPGSFIATSKEPLNISIYREGNLVAIIGTVTSGKEVKRGGEEQVLPVLAIKEIQLWKEYGTERDYDPDWIYEERDYYYEPYYRYSSPYYPYYYPYDTWPPGYFIFRFDGGHGSYPYPRHFRGDGRFRGFDGGRRPSPYRYRR